MRLGPRAWSDFAQAGARAEVDAADAVVGVVVQRAHRERVRGRDRDDLAGSEAARGHQITATQGAFALEPDEANHTGRDPGSLRREGLSG